jgi:hypothetical protein
LSVFVSVGLKLASPSLTYTMLPVILSLPLLLPVSITALHTPSPSANISHYTQAHSYSPAYSFQKRDGWETVPVSDLAYKYVRSNTTRDASPVERPRGRLERRSRKATPASGIGGAIEHAVDAALKAIGKIEQVTITW